MANIITWLKDRKKENMIVPKTLTKAVYDDNGVALSTILDEMGSSSIRVKTTIHTATFTKTTHSFIDIDDIVRAGLPSGATIVFANAVITGGGHQYVNSVNRNGDKYYLSYISSSTDTVSRQYALNVFYMV